MFGLRIGAMGRVGSGLTLNQAAANVRNAYSTSPQVWYDPSDLSTLYQDSAGTTPVTAVGQPVGLMLDKSRGLVLGSELVSNGDFSNGLTGWTAGNSATLSVLSGKLSVAAAATTDNAQARTSFATVIGVAYRVSVYIEAVSGSRSSVIAGTFAGGSNLPGLPQLTRTGTFSFVFVATTTVTFLAAVAFDQNTSVLFDNISVRELPGLHASQPTALSRPVLSSRYNLLTYTEQFDNAAWVKSDLTVTPNAATAPNGTMTADKAIANATTAGHDAYSAQTQGTGLHTMSIYAKAGEYSFMSVREANTTGTGALFNLAAGTIVFTSAGATSTIESVGNGWYRCSVTMTWGTNYRFGYSPLPTDAGIYPTYLGDGTSGIFIWGASLLPANESTLPYQRVTTATDYDADFSKFPPHLVCDGTDDGMVTPSWDLTSTDKVTVVAGVRKLSDAAGGAVLETSSTSSSNAGTIALFAPGSAAANFFWRARGTLSMAEGAATTASTYPAPITAVLAGQGSISEDIVTLRVNGGQAASSPADQGTGTFANQPLYLFRRGGTTLPFNGRFYGLSIIAAALSASDITVLEKFTAAKTGVTVA